MGFLIRLVIVAVAALASAYLLPGASIKNFWSALVFALLLGIANAIVKPVLLLLTLPINILTLGLFTLVINTLIVLLIDALMTGFNTSGFLAAFLFSVILSVITWLLDFVVPG